MKVLLTASLFLASVSAFAASVKVTSFNMIRTSTEPTSFISPLAELCGVVEGGSVPTFVRVLVDPKTKQPASYNTVADADGKFCVAVITYRGSADVTIIGQSAVTKAFVK